MNARSLRHAASGALGKSACAFPSASPGKDRTYLQCRLAVRGWTVPDSVRVPRLQSAGYHMQGGGSDGTRRPHRDRESQLAARNHAWGNGTTLGAHHSCKEPIREESDTARSATPRRR